MEVSDLYQEIYRRRFGKDVEFRKRMYQVLCADFFQKYIPEDATVLEIGAGYCEFTNNIKAKKKIALDLNPDIKKFAGDDVEAVIASSTDMKQIKNESIDVVFANNFFEHLKKEDIVETIREVYRVVKREGRFMILQPNIRFCFRDYWMFFDHITPLDDRSLSEVLETNGFKVIECKPKFLPYTTKSKLPKSIFLLKLYLKFPPVHKIFGKQAFIYAKKVCE
jgi:ubiquinone/menaquinone biosynthesis C-methylase UbiE